MFFLDITQHDLHINLPKCTYCHSACVALFLHVGLSVCLCAGVKCGIWASQVSRSSFSSSGVLFPVQSVLGSSLSQLWYSCHITGGGKEQLHRMLKHREALGEGDCLWFSLFQHNTQSPSILKKRLHLT